jgi:small subunit ribosomal protein S2
MTKQISLMELFEVGAHRGNGRSKTNPKVRSNIHSFHNGVSIINLVGTIDSIQHACDLMYKIGASKKQVLLVGTSNHIKHLVPEYADKFSSGEMPYVKNRWLGGTLTNWSTIKKTLKTLVKLENIEADTSFFTKLAKNEQLRISRQKEKISRFFDGLKTLKSNKPKAILVLDMDENSIAVKEANVAGIPVIGLSNTKVDVLPKDNSTTIICNTNSIATIQKITDILIESYNEGLKNSVEKKVEAPKEV